MNTYEKELFEVLRYAGLSDLPKSIKEEQPKCAWVRAVALVLKRSGEKGFAIAVNRVKGDPKLIKTFDITPIAKIEDIFPYEFVDKSFYPPTRSREAYITYISKTYNVNRQKVSELSVEKLQQLADYYAIERHEKRTEAIKAATEKRLANKNVKELSDNNNENDE